MQTVFFFYPKCSAYVVYTSAQENYSRKSTNPTKGDVMDARVTTIASIVLGKMTLEVLSTHIVWSWPFDIFNDKIMLLQQI